MQIDRRVTSQEAPAIPADLETMLTRFENAVDTLVAALNAHGDISGSLASSLDYHRLAADSAAGSMERAARQMNEASSEMDTAGTKMQVAAEQM